MAKRVTRGGRKGATYRVEWDDRGQRERFEKLLARNAEKAGQFLVGRVKQTLSKGQVVYRTSGARGGRRRLRSAERASPGAPPRVLTGRLRQSVDFKVVRRPNVVAVMIGAFTKYARRLELGYPRGHAAHPYLRPTIERSKKGLVRVFTKTDRARKRKAG